MNIDKEANKEEFIQLLRSTKREGIDYVIEDLEQDGFFEAPASAGHHLNCAGGLCQHSLNTYRAGLMIWEGLDALDPSVHNEVKKENVILATLLHDVCKTKIYKPTMKKAKNALGMWVDQPGYNISYKDLPIGHGEKSVVMLLLSGLELTDEEIMAIRWHMGAFDLNLNSYEDVRNYDTAKKLSPLVQIVESADSIAAGILETQAEDREKL